jgi:hypothetical protein
VGTMIPPDNRIPATIITGFLGSGKVRTVVPVACFKATISSYRHLYKLGSRDE